MYSNHKRCALTWCCMLLSCIMSKGSEHQDKRYSSAEALCHRLDKSQMPWFVKPMGIFFARNLAGAIIGEKTERDYDKEAYEKYKDTLGGTDYVYYRNQILLTLKECPTDAPAAYRLLVPQREQLDKKRERKRPSVYSCWPLR